MDSFVFRPVSGETGRIVKILDIAGESQRGMHVDPVIPGTGDFEDPLLGFEDPLLGTVPPTYIDDFVFG